jgi:recombination DNA repair RAD52 pathway protein
MNRGLLEQPFAPEQIRQRKGNFGNFLDYVEGHTVIQRLNDALDGDWSFEIKEHQILKEQNEVLVLGRLTAGAVVKTQFGSSAITRAKETGCPSLLSVVVTKTSINSSKK